MHSELNEALLKLRQAIIEAEKRKYAYFLSGFVKGAIVGGLVGFGALPSLSDSSLDGMDASELDGWADDLEEACDEVAWPEEN